MRLRSVALAAGLATGLVAVSGAAQAQYLFVVDSGNDAIAIHRASDGALVTASFIDMAAATGDLARTPIEALEVNGEIWVSDRVADTIWRFSQSGSLLGQVGSAGDFNNIRGMELVGSTLYVAQGSASDNFGESILTVDTNTATVTGSFLGRDAADVSYWDIASVNGELWVTNSDTGNDGIDRYATDGSFLGTLFVSDGVTGLDFGQQINLSADGMSVLVGGFSPPAGVYEFLLDGTDLGIVAGMDAGPRAAFELGNGEILWTNGAFTATGPSAGDLTVLNSGGQYRYITATAIPAPGAALAMGLTGLCMARRRR